MRGAAFLLVLFCAARAPRAPDPGFTDNLAKFDSQYLQTQEALRKAYNHHFSQMPDMRGRTIVNDLQKWVMTPDAQNRIRLLRERAIDSGSGAQLNEARQLLRAENERSRGIQQYWIEFPAPFWRQHWQRFAQANEMPSWPPPAPLLAADQQLVAQLDAGDFSGAAAVGAPRLVTELRAALKKAIPVIKKKRDGQKLRFLERRNPCGPVIAPHRNRAFSKYVGSPPVENFYPEDSENRGDEGAVVLRLKISDKGCVRGGAILVHSGFDELDAAALRWMETAEYSPGFENGRAVAGLTSIKVMFRYEN